MPQEPISLGAARALVLAETAPLEAEPVPLDQALDRHLAQDVEAAEDVPGFDNSAMDGYAVRSEDTMAAGEGQPQLRIAGESRAGAPARVSLGAGEAIRISTGAKLPDGADAVVRQEDVDAAGGIATIVVPVSAGQNVRRAGEDMAAGTVALRRGVRLGPSELGVAASAGRDSVACVRRPRVHVITTGDELVEPGAPRHDAGVWNSTALTAPAQIRRAGGLPSLAARIPDLPEPTRDAVRDGLDADVLIVCGGVSVGPHDHVKPALDELGVQERFWRVALRPGMPTWFGVHDRGDRRTLVFGLPGNPVSTMVTFQLFVHPALLALQGADPGPRAAVGFLAADVRKREGRTEAVRCRALPTDDGWRLSVTGPQDSHVLTSMLGADALAILPAERSELLAGERVPFELL